MRVFLTGASGILGSDIAKQLELAEHEVLAFNSSNIDLWNYNDVRNKMDGFRPDIVIHSAAMTNVDLCEDDKHAALRTNVIGSKNISMAADKLNARIVYISSCGIYGSGKTEPYTELDHATPQTYHHYTKLEGENRVKEHNSQFLIIRPGWLFGGTLQHKKNFVEARRKEAEKSALISSAVDKVGSPTFTADLAKQIIHLIDQEQFGTFNAVNEGCASRHEYVSEIVRLFNYNTIVEPVNSNAFPRKANMPDNECLENLNLNLIKGNKMRNWKDALKDYISSTYNL